MMVRGQTSLWMASGKTVLLVTAMPKLRRQTAGTLLAADDRCLYRLLTEAQG